MESLLTETQHMSIYLSSYTADNSHYNAVVAKFQQNIGKDLHTLKEAQVTLKSNQERIDLFQKYFEWVPIPPMFLERLQKSTETSSHFRHSGVQDATKDAMPSALRSLNLAVAFAPPNSEELLLAYIARSGVLVKISEWKLGLQDILRVEADPGSEQLEDAIKLEMAERRKVCEAALVKCGVELALKNRAWEQGANWAKDKLCTIKPNKLLPGVQEGIKMEWSEASGRKLVATEDIPAGTILLEDTPYATVQDGLLTWDTEHCASCSKPVLVGIPDLTSTFPMYCNESCRSSAKTLPNPILTYLHLTPPLRDTLLALTVLYHVPDAFQELDTQNIPGSIPGITSTYDASSYSSVYNLIQHPKIPDLSAPTPPNEFKALFLSHLVSILDPNHSSVSPSLILRHLENLPYSQISLSAWRADPMGSLSIPYFSQLAKQQDAPISSGSYASAIFTLVGLLNNSCDPNVVLFKNCRTQKGFLLATKRIAAGTELCLSYKGHWSTVGVTERQTYLRERYRFDCACAPCRAGLGPGSVLGCEGITGGEEDEEYLIGVEEELDEGVDMINKEKFGEALDIIGSCCDKLSRFEERFQLVVVAQMLLRRVVMQLAML